MERAAISNTQVGADIGLDYTTVSRIRSGQRLPSIDVMVQIELRYGWSVGDQARARTDDKFAEEFERILIEKFGVEVENANAGTSA